MLTKGASHIGSWSARGRSENCSLSEQNPDHPPSGRRLREGLEPTATFLALQPFPGLRPGRAVLGSPPLLPLDDPPGDERGRNTLGTGVVAPPARRDDSVVELAQHLLEGLGRSCEL